MSVFLPGIGQMKGTKESFEQANPVNSSYSPRLFGAPPQLTNLCDIRTLSGSDGHIGEVGNFYMNDILKNAQIANFAVGRALFTGGYNSLVAVGLNLLAYSYAMKHYGIDGNNSTSTQNADATSDALQQFSLDMYNKALEVDASKSSTEMIEEDLKAQEQLNELMGLNDTSTTNETTDTTANTTGTSNEGSGGGGYRRGGSTTNTTTPTGGEGVVEEEIKEGYKEIIQNRSNEIKQATSTEIQTKETIVNRVNEISEQVSAGYESTAAANSETYVDDATLESLLGDNYANLDQTGLEINDNLYEITNMEEAVNFCDLLSSIFNGVGQAVSDVVNTGKNQVITVGTAIMSSLLVNQPFYTFEADWYTYINNVKMMINTAIVMLGLQSAYVRIGNDYYTIGSSAKYKADVDVWTNYRFITPSKKLTTHTSVDNIKGETCQYVSFMCDASQESESYTNTTGESKIYANVMNAGNEYGTEIAFLTNSSENAIDDAVIQLVGSSVNAAQQVMQSLSGGVGRFTAAVASGMARSFTGDHTIYPKIFKEHTSNQQFAIHVKLKASRGDPYTYLIDVLVPLFHIFGMVLPKMSKNSSASYQFPPIVQMNVPGIWGTRLGMVTSVTVTKNPEGDGVSINGYPMSMNVDIVVEDLMHTLVTTPMDKPALFLNNNPMFDYIAQCTGVDKFRMNSAARIITKLALAASFSDDLFYNIGESIMTDITSLANKRIAQIG